MINVGQRISERMLSAYILEEVVGRRFRLEGVGSEGVDEV